MIHESPTVATRPAPAPAAPGPRAASTPAHLASDMSPPLRLPAAHFATALVFWLLGSAGLVWIAPDLARGGFAQPRVAAITHLFTLGWITTSIQGALYQFLPVALQTPIRSRRLAELGLAMYVPGLVLFLGGLLLTRPTVMVAGAGLFGTALLLFVGNLAVTLRRAPERNLTWWALVGSASSLVATIVLGVSLAGNLRWGYLGAERFLAVGVHLHVAIAGWVLLTIVGVAHRLLPMFLLSHGASELPGRAAAALLAAGVALLLATHHALTLWTTAAVALSLGGGVAALLTQALLYFRSRRKPALDPGLRLAGAGLVLLGCALLLAPFFLAAGLAAPRIATAYALTLVGAASLFVAGHYYKIVPFLIWFHRFGPLVGRRPVPRVVDLYSVTAGNAAALLLAAGAAGLGAGTLAGIGPMVTAAAVSFAVGATVLAVQMILIFTRRPA